MTTLDGFLRDVPSDSNPNDGRLYDPTISDGVARALVGALVVTAIIGGTMDVTRHYALTGGVTVTATPAATMDVTRHRALVGGLTVMAVPSSATDFARHAGAIGAVTVTVTPTATLTVTRHSHALAGDVTVEAIIASGMQRVQPLRVGGGMVDRVQRPPDITHTKDAEQPTSYTLVGKVSVETWVFGVPVYRAAPFVLPADDRVEDGAPTTRAVPEVQPNVVPAVAVEDRAPIAEVLPPPPVPALHARLAGAVAVLLVPRSVMAMTVAPIEPEPWSLERDNEDIDDILLLVMASR